jgi:ribonuclease E
VPATSVLFVAPDPAAAVKPARTRSGAPVKGGAKTGAKSGAKSGAKAGAKAETGESTETAAPQDSDSGRPSDEPGGNRRRRRRGGRRRRRGPDGEYTDIPAGEAGADDSHDDADDDDNDSDENGSDSEGTSSSSRRRRRRRRTGEHGEIALSPDDPPQTVVRVRERRDDEVTSVKGSTRLEAKRQRRRDGREAGRRRPPVLTEAEFLARRESVDRTMLVRQRGDRVQVAVLEDGVLVEHYVTRGDIASTSMVGNVYLGRVQNVLPSMEAAFVDIGRGRNAVLYAGEVNWDAVGLEGQPKRIESALKPGDPVLVQVSKDPMGHKGARLTSQISLPGRYLVFVPDGPMTGISRKLPEIERNRLKKVLRRVVPEDAGVIVRTAAEGATDEQLEGDVNRLRAQWDNIAERAKSAQAPALLYSEPDLAIKVVRDVFNEDFNRLIVEGRDVWDTVEQYVSYVAPDLADRLSKWVKPNDLFTEYRVDEQLAKALDRKVWLPSGGSLVIDRTEAMTVVDVNTGKFTGQGGNLEETVTRNNLEAAEEIVRQLRLRDIGGIIVVDFIDMVLENNRDLVLRRLVECFARDRSKHQVAEVTSLGLVQMTRKRMSQGLLETFSTPCESCNGRGYHIHTEPIENKDGEPAAARPERENKRPSRRGTRKRDVVVTEGAAEAIAEGTDAAPSAEPSDNHDHEHDNNGHHETDLVSAVSGGDNQE